MIEDCPELDPVILWEEVRQARLISIEDFADQLGVDPRSVFNWKSKNKNPSRPVRRLAAELRQKWQDKLEPVSR